MRLVRPHFILSSFLSPWIALAATSVSMVANLRLSRQTWYGDVLFSAEWLNTAYFLVSGLIAASAALDGYLLLHPDRHPWLRRPRATVLTLGCWAVAMLAALAIPTIFESLWMSRWIDFSTTSQSLAITSVAQILLSLLSLLVIALAGLLLGASLGRWGVPTALVWGYWLAMQAMGERKTPLTFGGVNGSLVGLTIPPAVQAVQLLSLASFALLFTISLTRPTSGKTLSRKSMALIVLAFLTLATVSGSQTRRYEAAAMARQRETGPCLVDAAGLPYACSTPAHRRLLENVGEHQAAALAAGRDLGIDLSPITEEWVPYQQPAPGTSYWHADPSALLLPGAVDRDQFLRDITIPATCPGLGSDSGPTPSFFENADALSALLAKQMDNAARTPTDHERAEAVRLWNALVACEGAK